MGALDRARIVQREINEQLHMLSLVGASEREYGHQRIVDLLESMESALDLEIEKIDAAATAQVLTSIKAQLERQSMRGAA